MTERDRCSGGKYISPLGLAGKGKEDETTASGEGGIPAARTSPALKKNPERQSMKTEGTVKKEQFSSNQLIFLIFCSDFQV